MNVPVIEIRGRDLASRSEAARQRYIIGDAVAHNGKVIVDLQGVLSISDSYADELFGVIAASKGLDWFLKHIVIKTSSRDVLRSIAVAIHRRIRDREEDVALIACA
jgi:hypothetical protein